MAQTYTAAKKHNDHIQVKHIIAIDMKLRVYSYND